MKHVKQASLRRERPARERVALAALGCLGVATALLALPYASSAWNHRGTCVWYIWESGRPVIETRALKESDGRNPPMSKTSIGWHPSTGFRAFIVDNFGGRSTNYDEYGRVVEQRDWSDGPLRIYTVEPWAWGEGDLASPDAPWIHLGLNVEEWWKSVPQRKKWPY